MGDKPNHEEFASEIVIPHRRSKNFISDFVSGTIVSVPYPDGTYRLIFMEIGFLDL
jgi:hypothetical protein